MTKEELATERNEVREILEDFSEELSQSNLDKISRVFCIINSDEKRIAELEQSLQKLQKSSFKMIDEKDTRIAELEARIEKMKCWCNCKNYLSCLKEYCLNNIPFEKGICYNCKKWEIKEND